MPSDTHGQSGARPVAKRARAGGADWSSQLKKMYDDIVSEPLPDSFEDLLDTLDKLDNG